MGLGNHWPLGRRPKVTTLPTVGVSLGETFVAVCLSGPPVQITGLYRHKLTDPDRQGGDHSTPEMLPRVFAEARKVLRVPLGTTVVVATPTADRSLRVPLANGWGRHPVSVRIDSQAVNSLEAAGFNVATADALPAALARFAHCSNIHRGRVRALGWTVEVTNHELLAETGRSVRTGDESAVDLRGVRIPRRVGQHLSCARDAAAIGAALREYGFAPDMLTEVAQIASALKPEGHLDDRSHQGGLTLGAATGQRSTGHGGIRHHRTD